MAIRYSGDVEVRIQPEAIRNRYLITMRGPDFRWSGSLVIPCPHSARSSESYDYIAEVVLDAASRTISRNRTRSRHKHTLSDLPLERQGARLVIRRTFQAPCPIP